MKDKEAVQIRSKGDCLQNMCIKEDSAALIGYEGRMEESEAYRSWD